MKKLGSQLIIEYYGCDKAILDDTNRIRQYMLTAAKKTGATIVGEVFHHFNPQGVSGAVIIAESHLSIHTWPEYNYAAVDFFTCGNTCDPQKGLTYLKEALKANGKSVKELERGYFDK